MPLEAGFRLGVYVIQGQLGAGGMGEVYRAHDTKLNRDVALKILPSEFAVDPDRLARFKREAQVLASLDHPNIGAIYGFEESDGIHALVLQLVEGPTLADRIAECPLPIAEALPIARQIADALEAAHDKGVIHRDLKPANIKIAPDGQVKVLDFGLAKLIDADAGPSSQIRGYSPGLTNSPTITTPAMTRMGIILGTAAYMSPEQAKGQPADKRSDVWSFGCVFYEMLTGTRAFEGQDVSDTLAAVLRGEPDWTKLPTVVPSLIRALVEGCLEKDRKERIADISTARFLLSERRTTVGSVPVAARRLTSTRAALLAAITASIAAIAGWSVRPSGNAVTPITRFSIRLGEDQRFTNGGRRLVAISPDGSQVIYVANQRLYLRSMSDLDARPIAGTESSTAVTSPVFSPDGRFVAFWSGTDRTLKKVAIGGGTAVTICQADNPFGMAWSSDGLVFGSDGQNIMRVSADGGTPELLVRVKSDELASTPQILPDGRGTLFTLETDNRDVPEKARIVVQTSGQSEPPQTLIEGATNGRYLSTGHIVYAVEGKLFAVSFDLRTLKVTSKPVLVVEGIARAGIGGVAHFAVSEGGSLVYVSGPASTTAREFELALLDRSGKIETLKLPPGPYEFPRVSPDGKQVAFGTDDGKEANVWIYELSGTNAMRRLTFGGRNRFPIWSADGQHVAFQSDREGDPGIFWQRAGVSGSAERLTKPEAGTSHVPESWSPKGDVLSFSAGMGSRFMLWVLALRDRRATRFAGVESGVLAGSAFSPDGRWLAYQSGNWALAGPPTRVTAYVEPFPPTGAKYQISKANGFHQFWSRNGKELFYSAGAGPGQWFVVDVTMRPSFALGNPVPVPGAGLLMGNPPLMPRNYDLTSDGRRIGVVRSDRSLSFDRLQTGNIQVVLNWSEELKQRVPTR
jgi:serine/threonine protein kinase/Tol biopolymer transport system component